VRVRPVGSSPGADVSPYSLNTLHKYSRSSPSGALRKHPPPSSSYFLMSSFLLSRSRSLGLLSVHLAFRYYYGPPTHFLLPR